MRSKAPLALMEQIVMVLVFALAAAICLQAFVASGKLSRQAEERDRAVVEAQNMAEALKYDGCVSYLRERNGNTGTEVFYNADWEAVPADAKDIAYCAAFRYVDGESAGLYRAEVEVCTADGQVLFSLPVAGQKEVAVHE